MFSNLDLNIMMLKGAFTKLKSYYYHNKNMLFIKEKIAIFELSSDYEKRFIDLAQYLKAPSNTTHIQTLIEEIDFRILPKGYYSKPENTEIVALSNLYRKEKSVEAVNFFIDAPVEIMILDTLWVLLFSKVIFDNSLIQDHMYGNIIDEKLIFTQGGTLENSIVFDSVHLFKNYYPLYCSWRDKAFNEMQERHKNKRDSLLFSLDLSSFFYRVKFKKSIFYQMPDLNSDLYRFSDLTDTMFLVYEKYTGIVSQNRIDLCIDKNKNECIFPIGLLSSLVLSNIYLTELDSNIIDKLSPVYYGRYVDDILIVKDITKQNAKRITQKKDRTDFFNGFMDIFVQTNLFTIDSEKMTIVSMPNLEIQKKKASCLHVSSNEKAIIFRIYTELFERKPSIIQNSIDFNLFFSNFSQYAHDFQLSERSPRVRDIANIFQQQNKAKRFLDNGIRCVFGTKHSNDERSGIVKENISDILDFYKDHNSLQDVAVWQSIFYFLVVCEKYSEANDFLSKTIKIIKKLKTPQGSKLDNIPKTISKNKELLKRVIHDLTSELEVAYSTAFALCPTKANKQYLDRIMCFRKANMFRNDLVLYPLSNFSHKVSDDNFSYTSFYDFNEIEFDYDLDKERIAKSPRFISLSEYNIYAFMAGLYTNKEGSDHYFSKAIEGKFYFYNKIKNNELLLDYRPNEDSGYKTTYYNISNTLTNGKKGFYPNKLAPIHDGELKVSVASVKLVKEEVINALIYGTRGLMISKKARVFKLINEAIEAKANVIVFPEYYLPFEWVKQVSDVAKKSGLVVVTGMNLFKIKNHVFNYSLIIQPLFSQKGNRNAIEIFREKNDYAPEEKTLLGKNGFYVKDAINPRYDVVNLGEVRYSLSVCYELSDIKARAMLSSKINLLFAVEFNSDTNYYSSLVESFSRDASSFVVQVNTAKYGDSRITGPYQTEYKDIIKIKGGINDSLIVGEIDVKSLNKHVSTYNSELNKAIKTIKPYKKADKIIKKIKKLSPQEIRNIYSEVKNFSPKEKPLSARKKID